MNSITGDTTIVPRSKHYLLLVQCMSSLSRLFGCLVVTNTAFEFYATRNLAMHISKFFQKKQQEQVGEKSK